MTTSTLLISDLHLQSDRPALTRALLQLLEQQQSKHAALYILGDLFEAWLGDDATDELAATVASALKAFSSASQVFLMHGNRDFLLGEDFAARCGARLLAEPQRLSCELGDVLLLHGDSLCTDDVDYQQFRRQVRDPDWQAQFLALPLQQRIEFASAAREQSKQATARKQQEIMDVNQQAVDRCMAEHGVSVLLHGHTHRPAIHELPPLPSAHTSRQRVVLGDWGEYGWYCVIDGQITLQRFRIASQAP